MKDELKRWYTLDAKKDKDLLAGSLSATYRRIRQDMRQRRKLDKQHMEMYANLDVTGDGYGQAQLAAIGGRMRYNVCQSIVDTAASVIAQQRPKPQYLTQNGDFKLQRQGRLRTQVLEGQLYETGAYQIMPQVFLDGAILGTGAVYGYLDATGKPKLERVSMLELWLDKTETIYGEPRTLIRTHLPQKDDLAALFPDHATAILKANGPNADERADLWLRADRHSDQVLVIEAWRLPIKNKDGKWVNGRHVMIVDTTVLVDEAWEEENFPFAFYRWSTRQLGFWGLGLVERVKDGQWRINQIIKSITNISDLGSNMHVFLQGDVKGPLENQFKVEQLSNAPCKIYRVTGEIPKFTTVNAVPTELFQLLDQEREQIYAQEGVSQMQAEGKKEPGLDSAPAQRTKDDLQTRRHIMNARAYEDAYMDLVRLLENLNERAHKNDADYSIKASSRRGQQEITKQVKWADVQMDKDEYRLTCFPTSALPTTPEGKMQAVQEWIAAGFISPPFAQQLLDFPDLDANTRLQIADLDYCMWQVEEILEGNEVLPRGYQDLALAVDITRRSLLQCEISNTPADICDALRDHMAALEATMPPATPPAPEVDPATGAPLAPTVQGPGAVPPMPTGAAPALNPAVPV